MVFLTSRNASKHALFALGVYRGTMKAGFRPPQCRVRLVSIHVPSVRKFTIASLTRHQANAVELATKVCFSLFDGSEVLALATKGKSCNIWCLRNLRLT